MDLKNCPRCGKLFLKKSRDICDLCWQAEGDAFDTVKSFIRDNPRALVYEVSEKTGVSEKVIMKFVREGRLLASGIVTDIKNVCDTCGKPIYKGEKCDDCTKELVNKFNDTFGLNSRDKDENVKENSDRYSAERKFLENINKRRN